MGEKAFDYKKEYKDLYMPKDKPMIVKVSSMNFIMVDGSGDPNQNAGNPNLKQNTKVMSEF